MSSSNGETSFKHKEMESVISDMEQKPSNIQSRFVRPNIPEIPQNSEIPQNRFVRPKIPEIPQNSEIPQNRFVRPNITEIPQNSEIPQNRFVRPNITEIPQNRFVRPISEDTLSPRITISSATSSSTFDSKRKKVLPEGVNVGPIVDKRVSITITNRPLEVSPRLNRVKYDTLLNNDKISIPNVNTLMVAPIERIDATVEDKRVSVAEKSKMEEENSIKEVLEKIDISVLKISNKKSIKGQKLYSLQELKNLAKLLKLPSSWSKMKYIETILHMYDQYFKDNKN